MKTKIQLTIILCFCWFAGFSQITDANTAYQKAVEFFEFKTNYEKSVSSHSYHVNHIIENDTTFIYVVDIDHVGWALVSAADNAGPYFAYSMHSFVDLNDMPPAAEMWFDYYKNITRHCMHNPQDMRFYQEEFMSKINEKTISQGSFYMIQTKWHQGPPFNNLVEDDDIGICNYSNNKCPAGCVAIAMAQIMRYWASPLKQKNKLPYDWCNMPEVISTQASSIQQNAIATLINDVGKAIAMIYCVAWSCNSFAFPSLAADQLVSYFGFSEDIDLKYRDLTNSNKWKEMLLDELNSYRPLLYVGSRDVLSTNWHALVCDGYDFDNDSYFHFNFGWGGSSDGFFNIFSSDVEENIPYNNLQQAIIGIYPSIHVECSDKTHTIYESYRDLSITESDSLYWFPYKSEIYTATEPDNVTIKNSEYAVFSAHTRIELKEFTVENGASFTAQIIECPTNCFFDIVYNNKNSLNYNNSSIKNDILTTKLSNKQLDEDLTIFPNPFWNYINVLTKYKESIITIYNVLGDKVYENIYSSIINLDYLKPGIYILRTVTENNDVFVETIIKQK